MLTPRLDLLRDTRGATLVEYALILSLVVVAGSPMLRSVGLKVKATFEATISGFAP